MAQEKLLNYIHDYLYTRRINLETGQGYIGNETIEKLVRQAKIENKWKIGRASCRERVSSAV